MTIAQQTFDTDVIIVGAGPSGTFLTNLLGQMGLSCILLEKRLDILASSMAIGVMPPSLRRLAHIDLIDPILKAGCPVTRASVLTENALLGTLDLRSLPPPFNYVLSIPQCYFPQIARSSVYF